MDIGTPRPGAPDPLALCRLARLMGLTSGDPGIVIGLVDGPVAVDHPGFQPRRVRGLAFPVARSAASRHGTFVAGILMGRRTSKAPAVCPGCTLLSRPVAGAETRGELPVMPDPLAAAIDDCLEAGVNVLNVSTVLAPGAATGSRALTRALDRAARLGVLVVVASGRAEPAGGSALTGHPWVVPVTSCTWSGMAAPCANLGSRRGRRALAAPGCGITSLDAPDGLAIRSGSDAAAPFVTGAAALLWSASPQASVDALRHALLSTALGSRAAPTPPLLDAWAAHEQLRAQRPAGPDLSLAP